MDYGFISISHIITISIINNGFQSSFCCFSSLPAYKYRDTDISNCKPTILMRQDVSL